MKVICILLVLAAALVMAYPVRAEGACDSPFVFAHAQIPVYFGVEQRGAIIRVDYDQEYSSLYLFQATLAYPWQMEITENDNAGFTAQIVRPLEYQQEQTAYLEYYAFGYLSVPCYYVNLPLVIH